MPPAPLTPTTHHPGAHLGIPPAPTDYFFVSKKNTKCPNDAEQVKPNKYNKQDCKNGGKEADSALDEVILCEWAANSDHSQRCSTRPYGCYMSDQGQRI